MKIVKKEVWISPKAEIRQSSIQGKGLFAKENIKKGERVIVFGGNYTDKKGAEKAQKQGKVVMQWDDKLYSFEDRGESDDYFINHSCDPNLWLIDAFTLVAKKDVNPGDELTADYALWEADEKFISSWKCTCGSQLCRGQITGKDWQKKDLQQRYRGHFSPLINKRMEKLKTLN